ncbi:YuzD family protein [Bacillus taeanensis]|uniref:Disulfide oxidoreductase n=1 Tax=Bacillus taeanensis TaxID=273032 RepID=A0A366Y1N6_9BACI|nr:YuzD family protein [Bacillus taeanensis]RBW71295.1 disulfide oxidoreductase [Bacillus taeanensis]
MGIQEVEILVYGAEQRCASCVNLPSSKETTEWLTAALERKYKDQPCVVRYVDIFNPTDEVEKVFAERVIEEELFYPIVVIKGEIIAEGNPRLKDIYKVMEQYGYKPTE